MSTEPLRVTLMGALDLALDVAYHDGTARDLAVAAEAYTLVGFHDGAIRVSHSGTHDDLMARVAAARKGRPRRLLRQRWFTRGGHDR